MVELPQRFVPTTSRFVSPVRVVVQSGHAHPIVAVAFSPCLNYFVSVDSRGWVRLWAVETLDVLGIYQLDFACRSVLWDNPVAIVIRGDDAERTITFDEAAATGAGAASEPVGYVIRLLDSPEVTRDGDVIRINYNEETFEHAVPGLCAYEVDPCERYVLVRSADRLLVLNTYADEVLMEVTAPEGHGWLDAKCSWRGDVCTALLDDGSVWLLNPMKRTSECVHKGGVRVTASAYGKDSFILVGDDRGSVAVFDIQARHVMLRTPRHPRTFDAVYPSPEKVGFVALRSESATAFLSQSLEILSAAPLPAALVASCPGMLTSEVVTACADNAVYRLKLDDNSIQKLCSLKKTPDVLACHNEMIVIHFTDGSSALCSGRNCRDLAWKSPVAPISLALSDDDKTIAALFEDRVDFIDIDDAASVRSCPLRGGMQIAFGKEKTAGSLLVFTEDLRVIAVDRNTLELTELGRLSVEHGHILSVAPAAKSFVFVLVATEHGHLSVFKVGLNSGKSSLALRVFAVGTQIWGATMNDESVSLRNDADCLRIVQGLKAFSVDDWTRSEPLALF